MSNSISLLFGVHAHQPVGNFDFVMEEAHVRCYRMFLQTVEQFPDFRFSVHFSGWLLDWLLDQYPEDMERLKRMTERGQVEWFGSGDCEPVLASIPHRDRVSQITALSDKIQHLYGVRPTGAWLTERVWESAVVPSLADTGIKYVAVDDYHFLCAGEPADKLDTYFTTEEDGRNLDLFPISEQARYRLPFSPADEAVRWMEQLAREGHRAVVYFDDIEKFGIWPETYAWVYEQGWLKRFIEGVLASSLIKTATYAEFHEQQNTGGIVYLPTTSYIEMNEWTLPAPAARTYHGLLDQEKFAGRFEQRKAFLRGGMWRNFFMRYPESNWMHKRMLQVSHRFAQLPAEMRTASMQAQLHRAQANDAFWHGLFGGLYLPHLRRAIWNNLLELEARLDEIAPPAPVASCDLDHDGHQEAFLRDVGLLAVIRADRHAMVAELSSLTLAHNFGDTLRRHDEGYHDKLRASAHEQARHSGIASAHDRVAFRHPVTIRDAEPDTRARGMFADRWIASDGTARPVENYEATGANSFSAQLGEFSIRKSFEISAGKLQVCYQCAPASNGQLEIQLNIAMPSCDGFLGRYVLENGDTPCGFGDPLELSETRQLTLDDGVLKGSLTLFCDQAVSIIARPHHTVSQSEAGFEKIMQAVELTLTWPIKAGAQQLMIALEARQHPA